MILSTLASKKWLLTEIEQKAGWYRHVATLFPELTREVPCHESLALLARLILILPDNHPLFVKLEQIQRVDGNVFQRWLDEIRLELAYTGHLSAEEVGQAIQSLTEITDASLAEGQQASTLH
jgi:hypothetical protein